MKREIAFCAFALALLLGARPLCAQRTLDTTLAIRPGTRLSVSNISGGVAVNGWDRGQVRIVAEAESDRPRVEIDEGPGRISVRTALPGRRGNGHVEYTVTVPVGTPVEIQGVNTDVRVGGVCGPTRVGTVNGDVNVDCAGDGTSVQTVSGEVTVTQARGNLEAGSTSGDVEVRGARGDVAAHTTSGDVTLSDIDGATVTAETVSGEVSYTGRVLDNGRYSLESHSGDVTMRVAGNLNATISVGTFSGNFEADFPIELAPGSRISRELEFRRGNGSARVRLRSFSGTIGLRLATGGSPREE